MSFGVIYGPGGAIEAASALDQICRIGHFNAAAVFRHPALYLPECLLVLWYAEGRKDKDFVGLEPVDIGPAVFREVLDIEIEFVYHLEVGLQDVPEPCRHLGIELVIVRHYDGVIIHKAYDTIGMAIHEVNWLHVLSVAAVAAIYSFLTSAVGKLPELEKPDLTPDGSLVIDESDPDTYGVFMNFGNKTVEDIAGKDKVILEIKNGPIPDDEPKE